ncbi:MAG: hypothetical protein LBK12_04135, partial [Odoribacteraceae bacterium]|nr:hypothetical protein [Odoribacteraceae bacterium]
MKHIAIQLTIIAALLAGGCSDESHPVASDNLGILDMFTPGADAAPEARQIFDDYGVWVRTRFASVQEITNGILEVDATVRRYGAENLDEGRLHEVYAYSSALLSNVSREFTRAFFPLEIFYVKTYGASYWIYPLKLLGRSRLIISWPNDPANTAPVADPANYYYQDSTLATGVWRLIATSITARLEEPVAEFVAAGKAYDNGKAYDQILNAYYSDYDVAKYDAAIEELMNTGGYLSGGGSRDFRSDFADWIRLLATESRENIQRDYLDNSAALANKYEAVVNFARRYQWDIQAAGNKFRQQYDAHK